MKIALIGGAGFIGTRLSKRLEKKNLDHIIYDIDKSIPCKNFVHLDIEDNESLSSIKDNDVIINLAAVHRDDVRPISRYDDVNVKGAVNLCKAASKYKINKIVFTSSVAIYGFAPGDTDENGEPNYFNDYGRTKYLAEQIFKNWQKADKENRSVVIVRPTVVFGEGNRGNVYNLLNQIASGKFLMVGNGKNKKSMAYIENIAAFLEHSLSFGNGLHVYNYTDKPDFDMNSLVSLVRNKLFGKNNVGIRLPSFLGILIGCISDFISKLIGKRLPVSSIRIKKFLSTTQFSSSISKTNFVPPVSLAEGLERTIQYEFVENNSNKKTFKTE